MGSGTIRVDEHVLALTFPKLKILTMLRKSQGEGVPLSNEEIIKGLYYRINTDRQVLLNRVKVHMSQLRKLLKGTGLNIHCYYGVGYVLSSQREMKNEK